MEKYIGIKLVEAKSLNLGEYNDYRGWIIPSNENPLREGYLVKYDTGYESWCPKEEFEKANVKVKSFPSIEETARPPHQQRVIDEMYDLEEKRLKLNAFIGGSEIFTKLDLDEQSRLKQQSLVMQAYVTILIERIENFK